MDNQLFERIHRYLSGQMPDAEAQVFADQIAADADLQAEVETQRQIKTAYQINKYKIMLAGLQTDLQASGQLWQPGQPVSVEPTEQIVVPELQRESVPTPRPNPVPARIAMAATVLLALGLGFYVWQNQTADKTSGGIARQDDKQAPPIDTIQQPNHSPASPAPTSGSRPELVPPVGQQPQLASRSEKLFDTHFDPILRRTPPDDNPLLTGPRPSLEALDQIPQDTLAVLRGIKLLKQGKAKAAISQLVIATDCALPDWQANARWFLALAYLRDNQPDKASPLLRVLANGKSPLYQADAQTLLTALAND